MNEKKSCKCKEVSCKKIRKIESKDSKISELIIAEEMPRPIYSYGTKIRVKKLYPEALIPSRKHPTDAGMDVYALRTTTIQPHSFEIIETGITCDFSNNSVIFVWPKSRAEFLIGAGVIDFTYQGQILVKIFNTSDKELRISRHQGIAQLVIVPVLRPSIVEVDEIHEVKTERGETGGIVSNSK